MKKKKKKKISNDDATILSVNAFRALERIILHRSTRVTRRRYILLIILRISSVFPQSYHVFYRPAVYDLYLFIGFYAYRVSQMAYPFRWTNQTNFRPLCSRKGDEDRIFFSRTCLSKKTLKTNFYPRISTFLNLCLSNCNNFLLFFFSLFLLKCVQM